MEPGYCDQLPPQTGPVRLLFTNCQTLTTLAYIHMVRTGLSIEKGINELGSKFAAPENNIIKHFLLVWCSNLYIISINRCLAGIGVSTYCIYIIERTVPVNRASKQIKFQYVFHPFTICCRDSANHIVHMLFKDPARHTSM